MSFLSNLQKLPEKKRKTILWVIVGFIALILALFWIRGIQKSVIDFQETDKDFFHIPSTDTEISEIKDTLKSIKE